MAINEKITSPITGSANVKYIGKIASDYIINNYCRQFNIDVSQYFFDCREVKIYQCLDTGYKFYYPLDLSGDSDFYQELEKNPYYYLADKWEQEQAFGLLEKSNIVLEIGCGRGSFLNRLKENNIAGFGLELNTAAIAACQRQGLNVCGQTISEYAIANKNKFDAVCCFQVAEHIAAIKEFIDSALAVLKPGGKLFISVPNNDSFLGLDQENFLNMPPHHMGLWGEFSLPKLAVYFKIKLSDIRLEPLQAYHVRYYYQVKFGQAIKKKFGILGKMINLLLILPACLLILIFSRKIKGFTVLAVYEKL